MQRKNLDVFEEADGLGVLAEMYGYSHSQIAEKIGKARSTITEILNIKKIPKEIRGLCKTFKIMSRSTLIEIAKQNTKEDMMKLFYEIRDRDLRRADTRDLSKVIKGKKKETEKKFVYNYRPQKNDKYRIRIEFKQQKVTKSEIIEILEDLIDKLRSK